VGRDEVIWDARQHRQDQDCGRRRTEENDAGVYKAYINGQVIENVESFILLGSEFTWDNDCLNYI